MSGPELRCTWTPANPNRWTVLPDEAPPAPSTPQPRTTLPYSFDAALVSTVLPGKRQWRPADPATGFAALGIDHQHLKGGRSQCPQCNDGKHNLSLDFSSGLFHCFKCDWSGNATHQHDHRPDAAQIQRQSEQRQAEQVQRGIARANAAYSAARQWDSLAKALAPGGHGRLGSPDRLHRRKQFVAAVAGGPPA